MGRKGINIHARIVVFVEKKVVNVEHVKIIVDYQHP